MCEKRCPRARRGAARRSVVLRAPFAATRRAASVARRGQPAAARPGARPRVGARSAAQGRGFRDPSAWISRETSVAAAAKRRASADTRRPSIRAVPKAPPAVAVTAAPKAPSAAARRAASVASRRRPAAARPGPRPRVGARSAAQGRDSGTRFVDKARDICCRSGEVPCIGAFESAKYPCCASGTTCCGDGCADTQRDPKNCGSCGNVCESGVCGGGICALP